MTFDIGSSPRQTDRPELSRRILTRMVQTARRESRADIESSFRTSHPDQDHPAHDRHGPDIDAAMFARERKSTFRTKTMIGENEHREERKSKTKKDRRKTIQEETRKKTTTKKKKEPQPRQKDRRNQNRPQNKNYKHKKETTRVLHPASRLTPGNGGIPPFLSVVLINVRVLARYR